MLVGDRQAAAVEPATPGWSAAGLVDLATYVQSQKTTGFLIIIVPSRKLIVVRTGQAAPDRDFNQQIWLRLMKAAPRRG
jgi:hypothetical protein